MPRFRERLLAWVAVGVSFTSWATHARAEHIRTLDPERIREAISFGEQATEDDLLQYELERVDGYVLNCDTPFLRVAQLARAMKASEATLDDEEVSPRLTADVLHLYLHPREESGAAAPPRVESVLLESPREKGLGDRLVLPLSLQAARRRATAAVGDANPSRPSPVRAVFPMSALAPDASLAIRFEDGTTRRVRLDAEWLRSLR